MNVEGRIRLSGPAFVRSGFGYDPDIIPTTATQGNNVSSSRSKV